MIHYMMAEPVPETGPSADTDSLGVSNIILGVFPVPGDFPVGQVWRTVERTRRMTEGVGSNYTFGGYYGASLDNEVPYGEGFIWDSGAIWTVSVSNTGLINPSPSVTWSPMPGTTVLGPIDGAVFSLPLGEDVVITTEAWTTMHFHQLVGATYYDEEHHHIQVSAVLASSGASLGTYHRYVARRVAEGTLGASEGPIVIAPRDYDRGGYTGDAGAGFRAAVVGGVRTWFPGSAVQMYDEAPPYTFKVRYIPPKQYLCPMDMSYYITGTPDPAVTMSNLATYQQNNYRWPGTGILKGPTDSDVEFNVAYTEGMGLPQRLWVQPQFSPVAFRVNGVVAPIQPVDLAHLNYAEYADGAVPLSNFTISKGVV